MKRFLAILLCLAMLASLAGCGEKPVTTEPTETTAPPETTAPAPTAAELYAEAAEGLRQKKDLTMKVTYIRSMTLGVETLKETIQQEVILRDMGTDSFCASLEETWYNGSFLTVTSEVFTGGKLYAQLNYDCFSAEMTGEEYLDRLVPVVMLDESLYETVEHSGKEYSFSGATALEGWVDNPYAQLISAEGTAKVDSDGSITETAYKAQFAQGPGKVELSVTVKFSEDPGDPIQVPDKGEHYVLQDTPDAPAMVLRAAGYIYQADSLQTEYLEVTTVEAGNYLEVYGKDIATWGRLATQAAKITHMVQAMDLSTGEMLDDYVMEETYLDGVVTTVIDGGRPEEETGFVPTDVRTSAENAAIGLLPDTRQVKDYDLTVIGDMLILDFTWESSTAEEIVNNVLDSVLEDSEGFLESATRYSTREAKGTLCLDAATLMPLAATQTITGTHTVDGEKLATSLECQQSFLLADRSAYETITGEELPEEEPETKPAPLFYHVTGADGQEMWLLGTIHVGDVRTKHLPQEIYDAFDSADAMAMEYESDAFMEQAESDEELMKQIRDAYLYTDGTLLGDHISDDQLYNDTIRLLKVTGQHNQMVVLYKPYFLAQMLEGFLRDRSYAMSSDYGVDFLLEDRANEQEKEIRSVESGISQIEMMSNFSDGLQEMMLAETVHYGHVYSNLATAELFEMWCRGDENELREYINAQPEDMTEEEQALKAEYDKAISTDRNIRMVEVAKGYLESGDTVFYAVGLAHLLANDSGLVDALRAAGYTVELVSYS